MKLKSDTQENFYFVPPSSKNTPTNDRSNQSSTKSKQFMSIDHSQVKGGLIQTLYKEIDKYNCKLEQDSRKWTFTFNNKLNNVMNCWGKNASVGTN